jgi:lipopolysaccharide/colanic/teichoic acid biosynthesis glycosyltransferase
MKRPRPLGKRTFDIVVASAGLIVVAPLVAMTALAVRVRLGSPVLFRQTRSGLAGQPFELVKFRTMTSATDEAGNLLPDDERLTRLGRMLRASSLDELPQLVNLLRGDMSLVGPRPLHARYLERYSSHQRRRLEVRPGLTGPAQVMGRNLLQWEDRFDLEVWYVDNRSWRLDLRILARTVPAVLTGWGVSAEGVATMREFEGSAGYTSRAA